MSVIGRLDKQVEDTLISPVEKRNKQQRVEDDSQTQKDETPTPAETHTQSVPESSENRRAELPVWLL